MSVIAYKFQAPNGSYWYIKADDQRTIDYWKDKRTLIPLNDDRARITADGAVTESDAVDRAWNRFNECVSDGPDAPFPGMAQAFEAYFSQRWNDKAWRKETAVWAAAWKAAKA